MFIYILKHVHILAHLLTQGSSWSYWCSRPTRPTRPSRKFIVHSSSVVTYISFVYDTTHCTISQITLSSLNLFLPILSLPLSLLSNLSPPLFLLSPSAFPPVLLLFSSCPLPLFYLGWARKWWQGWTTRSTWREWWIRSNWSKGSSWSTRKYATNLILLDIIWVTLPVCRVPLDHEEIEGCKANQEAPAEMETQAPGVLRVS